MCLRPHAKSSGWGRVVATVGAASVLAFGCGNGDADPPGPTTTTSAVGGGGGGSAGSCDVSVETLASDAFEGGTDARFRLALTTQPTGDVRLHLQSAEPDQAVVSSETFDFTPQNWDSSEHVLTVSAVDDDVAEGDTTLLVLLTETSGADAACSGLDPDDIEVTVRDNDVAGFLVVDAPGVETWEVGNDTSVSVVLTTSPQSDVTIPITSSDPGEGAPASDSLVFTPGDWATPKSVQLSGIDDDIDDGDQPYVVTVGPTASNDVHFDNLAATNFNLTNRDDDTAGIEVELSADPGFTSELGDSISVGIRLDSEPTADVVINITSSDPTEGQVSPATIVFNSTTWGTQQWVDVQGQDDAIPDGKQSYTVDFEVTSTDSTYAAMTIPSLSLDNYEGGATCAAIVTAGESVGSGVYALSNGLYYCDMSGAGVAVGPATLSVVCNSSVLNHYNESLDQWCRNSYTQTFYSPTWSSSSCSHSSPEYYCDYSTGPAYACSTNSGSCQSAVVSYTSASQADTYCTLGFCYYNGHSTTRIGSITCSFTNCPTPQWRDN